MESTLMNAFRAKVSQSKDPRLSAEAQMDVCYPTGFLNFDFLNGSIVKINNPNCPVSQYYSCGIPDGSMVEFIGRSGCGKTTAIVQMAANIVRPFEEGCIWHDDIEGGSTEARRMQLTGFTTEELENKYLVRNTGITAENFYERLQSLFDLKMQNRDKYIYDTGLYDTHGNKIYKLQPSVYILDSLALLMPGKFTQEEEISGQMSATAAAKMNSMSFKRIIPMLKAANIILFIVNHITTKIEINPMMHTKGQLTYLKQGEELPGGRTVNYLANLLVRLDDNDKLKEKDGFGITGNMVDFTLVKSRNSRAGQSTTLVFNQAEGFDPDLSLFVMLKNAGRIKGAGAYLYIDDHSDIKFAQRNFKELLATNETLQDYFATAVSEVLMSMPMDVVSGVAQTFSRSSAIMNKIQSMGMVK